MADATPQSPESSPETAHEITPDLGKESFAALLEESLGSVERLEGSVLKGTVVAIEGDVAVVDVGLKSEGRVALKEFAQGGQPAEIAEGDEVEVTVGDSAFEQGGHRVVVEGEGILDGVMTPAGQYQTASAAVALRDGNLTVEQLTDASCRLLYRRVGTYGAVAQRTQLDSRTVKKYLQKNYNQNIS